MLEQRKEYSLLELNNRIKQTVISTFSDTYWVRGEMCDVRVNSSSGHCYLELIEKHALNGRIVARARANIWAKTFAFVKPHFEYETGQLFTSGLEVLVKVLVEYHEIYGFSYTVVDIDPTYTLGEIVKRRMDIIRRLQEDGIFTLNREVEFPVLPTRIAVITSPTAAGYEDFMEQLHHNSHGFVFYTKLFPAVMQGEQVEETIIRALDRIYDSLDNFDLVVIIRGGGSTSDLNCFDTYPLAANCAQFPLPVLTGIGHERDESILDIVAHKKLKTPTAVAEFLINYLAAADFELQDIRMAIFDSANDVIAAENRILQFIGSKFPGITLNRIEKERFSLQSICNHLQVGSVNLIAKNQTDIAALGHHLKQETQELLNSDKQFLELTEQYITMASPEYILKRGYSLILKDGEIMKRAGQVEENDNLTICFADGEVQTKVISK